MEDRMDEAYSAACLACGRVLGHVYRRMYYAESPSARLERAARQFRCSRCHGSVLFERHDFLTKSLPRALREPRGAHGPFSESNGGYPVQYYGARPGFHGRSRQ